MIADSAFELVYNRQADRVYRISFVILKNREDALDISQTVFMRYLNNHPVFHDDDHESAWFIHVTQNACKDMIKHWWRKKRKDTDLSLIAQPENRSLLEELMNLPEKHRTVLYYTYYEGYTSKELAILLNTNESTIRSRLVKARDGLRKELTDEEP